MAAVRWRERSVELIYLLGAIYLLEDGGGVRERWRGEKEKERKKASKYR